ncbi:amidohydrolase [Mycoplasmopsis cricetuli]|uniref:amidohydrolase n=1 Tax=Mycoplasmopsis cricetuli TaxID=171283 RepID=UPI00047242A1|nr:amidohydrolase family protein [Mycoplasmopsis cricetuli]
MIVGYINGKVWIEKNKFKEAFIVKNKKITFVGTTKEILERKPNKIVDLKRKVVLPGLMDSHIHFLFAAKYDSYVNLSKAKNHQELINILIDFNQKNQVKENDVLIGYDWDETQFQEKKRFSKELLDYYFPNISVFLWKKSYHSAIANTHALKRLNIFYPNAFYEKSYIELDQNNMPTGFLKEKICYKSDVLISNEQIKKQKNNFLKWIKIANQLGITGIFTCDLRNDNWENDFNIFEELNNKNQISLEIAHQLWLTEEKWQHDFLNKIGNLKIKKDNHKLRAIKVFADGTFSNNTVNLKHLNKKDNLFIDENNFYKFVKKINDKNLSVVVHSIGNLTSDIVVNNFIKADPYNKNRNGLIHSDVLDDELINLIKKHNINLSLQPCFLELDTEQNLNVKKLPLKKLFNQNIKVSFGTDWKVCDLNPWKNIYWAVNHPDKNSRIKIYQAIEAYTLGTANYMKIDDKVGIIKKGYFANFIVLKNNIFKMNKKNIKNVKVLSTYFRGKLVT